MQISKRLTQTLAGIAVVLAALSAPAATSAAAEDAANALRAKMGLEVAKTWCANCHLASRESTSAVQTDVPTFPEIADRDDQSASKIENFLFAPTHPMPKLDLSREEIRNLTAYILSLRTKSAE